MRHNGRLTALAGLITVLVMAATPAAAQQQRADVRLEQAIQVEQVQGDLPRAIAMYQRILRDFPRDRTAGARAQLHIGLCYEALGRGEAQRAYERVISDYGDQADEVRQARTRLAALQPAGAAAQARGPVARRLLSGEDTEFNDFNDMVPSPDGRRVAYTRLGTDGALMVRDLATGATELIAAGQPSVWNAHPVWSADGSRLAYSSRGTPVGPGTVRIVDVATRREVVAFPADRSTPLDWSRDGRLLLVRSSAPGRAGNTSLHLLTIADGATVPLADSVPRFSLASFSPDSRYVAFAVQEGAHTQVMVRPVAGGALRRITDADGGDSPRWSPDGRAIAFTREDGVYVVPVADGAVNGPAQLAYATEGAYPQAWLESGGLYLTIFGGTSASYRVTVDPQTGASRSDAAERLPDPVQSTGTFAWSPDMRSIAFAGQGQVVSVYSLERGTVTRFDVGPRATMAWDLWWSADGREIVWEPDVRSYPGVVLALDPATGRVREPFARVAEAGIISMSGDGSRVVYSRATAESRFGELVVAPTGRPEAAVVVAAARNPDAGRLSTWVRPRFSPQGDRVLYGRQDNGGTLWVVGSDGTDSRMLGRVSLIWFAAWDPTGRFIAYTGSDGGRAVLRVVDVGTGTVRDLAVPNPQADMLRVTDWSRDGRFIGLLGGEARWEYWQVQGLTDNGR